MEMIDARVIILIHQIVFQGMFVSKNMVLRRKLGKPIRGSNKEAMISVAFFVVFIAAALVLSALEHPVGKVRVLSSVVAMISGVSLLIANLIVSAASLVGLKDSWRVGVLEDQTTELVSSGIYRFTRNPYFLSYFLMLAAYTVILQNAVLLGLSTLGVLFTHRMILKEEEYLYSVHGAHYLRYKQEVPRYIFL